LARPFIVIVALSPTVGWASLRATLIKRPIALAVGVLAGAPHRPSARLRVAGRRANVPCMRSINVSATAVWPNPAVNRTPRKRVAGYLGR